MRKNLVRVSFLALAVSLLASCGEADKTATESDNAMSDKVILARAPIDSNGFATGDIETIIVNKKDIRSNSDIPVAFRNNKSTLNPNLTIKRVEKTSKNNCMGRACMVSSGWNNNFYVGASTCTVRTGCMWFPGKNILKFAGRVVHAVGEGLSGLGAGLWHGANGTRLVSDSCVLYGGADCRMVGSTYVRPWTGANFSYRAQGCASVSCTTFYAPSYRDTFVENNYSYTKYHQVSSPYFNETDYESVQSSNVSSSRGF